MNHSLDHIIDDESIRMLIQIAEKGRGKLLEIAHEIQDIRSVVQNAATLSMLLAAGMIKVSDVGAELLEPGWQVLANTNVEHARSSRPWAEPDYVAIAWWTAYTPTAQELSAFLGDLQNNDLERSGRLAQ